jgi:hypothetical protein
LDLFDVAALEAAEERLRKAILGGFDYEGKAEDLELVRRNHRKLGPERLRRVLGYGQEGTVRRRGGGYGN